MADGQKIRAMAVDDHPLMRSGIVGAVNAQANMTVVAEASNGEEAYEAFKTNRPDITLMDLRLPTRSGIETIYAIKSDYPAARIIVLTTYGGDMQALHAFKAGASGYLLKTMLRAELIETIRLVHAGHRRIPAEIAHVLAEHAGGDMLTIRELDVLQSVAAGRSNKTIADFLNLSEHTIKGHVRSILAKLEASDRTHAVMIALKRGIIEQ